MAGRKDEQTALASQEEEDAGHDDQGPLVVCLDADEVAMRLRINVARRMGGGATARVYQGSFDGKAVAVKVVHPSAARKEDVVSSFLREAHLLARLQHGNIIRVSALCQVPPAFCGLPTRRFTWGLCLELMEGGPLTQYIQRAMQVPDQQVPSEATDEKYQGQADGEGAGGGHAPAKSGLSVSFAPDTQPAPGPTAVPAGYSDLEAICWCLDIARALDYLHSQRPPIIHRDIKTENILMSEAPMPSTWIQTGITPAGADADISIAPRTKSRRGLSASQRTVGPLSPGKEHHDTQQAGRGLSATQQTVGLSPADKENQGPQKAEDNTNSKHYVAKLGDFGLHVVLDANRPTNNLPQRSSMSALSNDSGYLGLLQPVGSATSSRSFNPSAPASHLLRQSRERSRRPSDAPPGQTAHHQLLDSPWAMAGGSHEGAPGSGRSRSAFGPPHLLASRALTETNSGNARRSSGAFPSGLVPQSSLGKAEALALANNSNDPPSHSAQLSRLQQQASGPVPRSKRVTGSSGLALDGAGSSCGTPVHAGHGGDNVGLVSAALATRLNALITPSQERHTSSRDRVTTHDRSTSNDHITRPDRKTALADNRRPSFLRELPPNSPLRRQSTADSKLDCPSPTSAAMPQVRGSMGGRDLLNSSSPRSPAAAYGAGPGSENWRKHSSGGLKHSHSITDMGSLLQHRPSYSQQQASSGPLQRLAPTGPGERVVAPGSAGQQAPLLPLPTHHGASKPHTSSLSGSGRDSTVLAAALQQHLGTVTPAAHGGAPPPILTPRTSRLSPASNAGRSGSPSGAQVLPGATPVPGQHSPGGSGSGVPTALAPHRRPSAGGVSSPHSSSSPAAHQHHPWVGKPPGPRVSYPSAAGHQQPGSHLGLSRGSGAGTPSRFSEEGEGGTLTMLHRGGGQLPAVSSHSGSSRGHSLPAMPVDPALLAAGAASNPGPSGATLVVPQHMSSHTSWSASHPGSSYPGSSHSRPNSTAPAVPEPHYHMMEGVEEGAHEGSRGSSSSTHDPEDDEATRCSTTALAVQLLRQHPPAGGRPHGFSQTPPKVPSSTKSTVEGLELPVSKAAVTTQPGGGSRGGETVPGALQTALASDSPRSSSTTTAVASRADRFTRHGLPLPSTTSSAVVTEMLMMSHDTDGSDSGAGSGTDEQGGGKVARRSSSSRGRLKATRMSRASEGSGNESSGTRPTVGAGAGSSSGAAGGLLPPALRTSQTGKAHRLSFSSAPPPLPPVPAVPAPQHPERHHQASAQQDAVAQQSSLIPAAQPNEQTSSPSLPAQGAARGATQESGARMSLPEQGQAALLPTGLPAAYVPKSAISHHAVSADPSLEQQSDLPDEQQLRQGDKAKVQFSTPPPSLAEQAAAPSVAAGLLHLPGVTSGSTGTVFARSPLRKSSSKEGFSSTQEAGAGEHRAHKHPRRVVSSNEGHTFGTRHRHPLSPRSPPSNLSATSSGSGGGSAHGVPHKRLRPNPASFSYFPPKDRSYLRQWAVDQAQRQRRARAAGSEGPTLRQTKSLTVSDPSSGPPSGNLQVPAVQPQPVRDQPRPPAHARPPPLTVPPSSINYAPVVAIHQQQQQRSPAAVDSRGAGQGATAWGNSQGSARRGSTGDIPAGGEGSKPTSAAALPARPSSLDLARAARRNSRLSSSFTSSPGPTPARLSLNLPTVGTASLPALPAGSGTGVRAIVHGNSVGSRVDAIRNQVARDAALGSPSSASGHHHLGSTGSGGLLDAWHGVSSHHHSAHQLHHPRHALTAVSSTLQGAGGSTGSLPPIPGVPPTSSSMSAHAGSASRGVSQPGLRVQFSTLVHAGGSGGDKRVSFPAERALAHAGGGGGSFQSTGASSIAARMSAGLAAAQALALARESARMSLSVAVSGSELPSEWGGGTPRTTGEPHSPAGDAGWGPSHSMYLVTGRAGTSLYMAPEIQRDELYNERVDIYSFAIVMYEVFGRTLLLEGRTREEVDALCARIAAGYRPRRLERITHEGVWGLITSCWAQDPSQRPPMSSVVAQLAAIKEAMEEEVIAAAALAAAGKGLGALSGSIARGASGLLRDSAGGGSSPRAVTRAMSSTRGALRGFTQSFKSRAGTASQRSLASHDGARTSTRTSTGSAVARATSALLGRVASVRGPAGMTSNLGAGAAATAAGLPVAGGSQGEGVLASERRTRSNSLGDLLEPPPKKGCAPSVCGCVIC